LLLHKFDKDYIDVTLTMVIKDVWRWKVKDIPTFKHGHYLYIVRQSNPSFKDGNYIFVVQCSLNQRYNKTLF
jgi:hypothetical protein